ALDWAAVAALAPIFAAGGSKMAGVALALAEAAERAAADPLAAYDALLQATHTRERRPRALSGFVTKPAEAAHPGLGARFQALQEAVDAVERDRLTALAAAKAGDLNHFAARFLVDYSAAKRRHGVVDFDDLVARAAELLAASGAAAWVLYRLDGGIDHILVDEAQDTAPAQWAVVGAIAQEFMAGDGARGPRPRTLFVVGDEKQSIYSFQGADPQVFGTERGRLRASLAERGAPLVEPGLTRSFRSAPGILAFVDRVFAGDAAEGLTLAGTPPVHEAGRSADAATIDLWAPVVAEAAGEQPPWHAPVDAPMPDAPKRRLAEILAAEIARICTEERLPARDGVERPVAPGDILVLVRSRDALAAGLVRALKARGVAVAGADKMTLDRELAVIDLMAALRVEVLPDDELSLATLLRSPLGDVDEAGLMALAAGRDPRAQPLVRRLQAAAERHPRAWALVADLMAHADFERPYEMLERVLIGHDGRARLLARLGAEAEDAIDELLTQALVYEGQGAPTLTGFIAWFDGAEIQAKRELAQAAGAVRVMTVHGAKGLEAPFVILPDTFRHPLGRRGGEPDLLTLPGDGNRPPLVLMASGGQSEDDALIARARDEATRRAVAEYKRLLYVALTRAEQRLLICGAVQRWTPPGDEDEATRRRHEREEAQHPLRAQVRRAHWYPMLWHAVAPQPAPQPAPEPAAEPAPEPAPAPERAPESAADRASDPAAHPARYPSDGSGPYPAARPIAPPDGVAAAWRLGSDPAARAPASPTPKAPDPHPPEAPGDPSARPVAARPGWAVAAPIEARPRRLNPSGLADAGRDPAPTQRQAPRPADPAAVGDDRGGAAPRDWGLAVHALLERPALLDRPDVAAAAVRAAAPGFPPAALAPALAEARAVAADPALARYLDSAALAEVAVGAPLGQDRMPTDAATAGGFLSGRIDRLLVGPATVEVVDLKTDRPVPADPAALPAGYLAQLGAYLVCLERLYPGHRLMPGLLYTAGPRLLQPDATACVAAYRAAVDRG
ncbi:MAG: UvrD-helicase domain-containing protein, partial [Pseudomonadota bacterium]